MAGTDEEKIDEIHSFFLDKNIKLIIAARGGYGSIRLINKINYKLIKENSKPFCGFSDVTALLLMLYRKAKIITYHSPMASSDFCINSVSEYTKENFFNALNSSQLYFEGGTIYKHGHAEGVIWGGNLATVVSLCGQDFIPDEEFIFFAEDLNEPVYKIDKMFNQLFNIEKFIHNCKGIVLGDFLSTDNNIWLEELFQELASKLNIPIASGFKITHNKDKITLPIGAKSILDENKLSIYNS